MELVRYGHDAWGQAVVNGVSWGLLPWVVGAGAAVIVVHLVVRALTGSGRGSSRTRRDGADA